MLETSHLSRMPHVRNWNAGCIELLSILHVESASLSNHMQALSQTVPGVWDYSSSLLLSIRLFSTTYPIYIPYTLELILTFTHLYQGLLLIEIVYPQLDLLRVVFINLDTFNIIICIGFIFPAYWFDCAVQNWLYFFAHLSAKVSLRGTV